MGDRIGRWLSWLADVGEGFSEDERRALAQLGTRIARDALRWTQAAIAVRRASGDETRAADLAMLGFSPTAEPNPDAIRAAYYKRALLFHPDRGGSREAFEALRACYARLTRTGTAPEKG